MVPATSERISGRNAEFELERRALASASGLGSLTAHGVEV